MQGEDLETALTSQDGRTACFKAECNACGGVSFRSHCLKDTESRQASNAQDMLHLGKAYSKLSQDLSLELADVYLAAAGGGAYEPAPPLSIRALMARSRSSCSFFSFSLACSSRATLFLVSTAQQAIMSSGSTAIQHSVWQCDKHAEVCGRSQAANFEL